jgi:6-phosphogluconolactonase
VVTATLAAVGALAARRAVDWSQVDLWWGDERFLPEGDPERNETQARAALLDLLSIPAARVHAMPACQGGGWGDDPDAAARAYAEELAAATGDAAVAPSFDVVLLGVGPDGHVASLFPGHPALEVTSGVTVAVRESPKPPPVRVSLTVEAINAAHEVWLLAAGTEKADAVGTAFRQSLAGARDGLPASRVRGRTATLWLLDRAAAAHLPA